MNFVHILCKCICVLWKCIYVLEEQAVHSCRSIYLAAKKQISVFPKLSNYFLKEKKNVKQNFLKGPKIKVFVVIYIFWDEGVHFQTVSPERHS